MTMPPFYALIAMVHAVLIIASVLGAVVSAIREPAISREEEERAWMRSLSWPTDGSQFRGKR